MAACEASGSTVAAAPPVPTATACFGGTGGPWATAVLEKATATMVTVKTSTSETTGRIAAVQWKASGMIKGGSASRRLPGPRPIVEPNPRLGGMQGGRAIVALASLEPCVDLY
jgi:hypothetical protein